MEKFSKIYVAGHTGMVGSAIVRKLKASGYTNLLLITSTALDLRLQSNVEDFFRKEKPDYVFLAAGKVGGIEANNRFKANFLYDNLMIQTNVIHHSYQVGVKKLLFLGSSCIYPKFANQPISENEMLTGPLEPTNDAYAIAKIAGIKMCDAYRKQYQCNFISVMPTNLYGPNDNYHPEYSHVLPALLQRMILAKKTNSKTIEIWGTGKPKREFLYVDDLADACILLMHNYSEDGHVNIGTGEDLSILELVQKIKEVVGFEGKIVHDLSKPDGTPKKLLDISKIKNLGWRPRISLDDGIRMVYSLVKNEF